MVYHILYTVLVLASFPTIPADLKALGDVQFKVREAATERLESLPGWTALYFKPYARKAKDLEVRIRCRSVYERLAWKNRQEMAWWSVKFGREKLNIEARAKYEQIVTMIVANLARLSAEDLKLAVAQGSCPIQEDVPLGGKGVPVKIVLKGHPVLLCCKECIKEAQANPDKTLAKVKERKEKPLWNLRRFLT